MEGKAVGIRISRINALFKVIECDRNTSNRGKALFIFKGFFQIKDSRAI